MRAFEKTLDLWLAAAMTGRGIGGRLGGWPLVGWCAVFLAAMTGTILAVYGAEEHGLRIVIRSTAKTSFLLFISAFTASALLRTWPAPATRWMLHNRRYLGVSFAVSHVIHLIAIVALARLPGDKFKPDPVTLVVLGLGYVFIAAMTATSFDRTAAWIGPRAWRVLHVTGGYYIWSTFLASYAPRAAIESVLYMPFVVVLLAALGLRVFAGRRQRITAIAGALP